MLRRSDDLSKAGQITEAAPLLLEALNLYEELDDSGRSAEVSYLLATNMASQRRPGEARRYYLQAAELRLQRGEILRWALDSALAAAARTYEGRIDQILLRFEELYAALRSLRAAGGLVRVSGLERHVGAFPPELAKIILAGRLETLPLEGPGGLAITVVEAALLDMEIDFHIYLHRFEKARERIHLLESKARAGAGTYFRILAAFAECRLEHRPGRTEEALGRCEEAAALFEELERPAGVADTMLRTIKHQIYLQLIDLHEERGDFGEVVRLESKSWPGAPSFDPCARGKLEYRRAVTKIHLGYFEGAKELLEAAKTTMNRAGGCGGLEAQVAALLSTTEVAIGDLGAAQGHAEEAIGLAETSGDPRVLARAWMARLNMDLFLGDMDRARSSLDEIRRLDPDGGLASEAQFNFEILDSLHDKEALKSRAVLREILRANPGLANVGSSSAQRQLAIAILREISEAPSWGALESGLRRLLGTSPQTLLERSQILSLLAIAAFGDDRPSAAADYLAQALPLYEEGGLNPSLLLASIGKFAFEQRRLDDALPGLERARLLLEKTFETLRSDASRIRFLDSGYQGVYRLLIEVLIDTGRIEEAFELSEAARQRALLQSLSVPRVVPNDGTVTSSAAETGLALQPHDGRSDRPGTEEIVRLGGQGSDRQEILTKQARAGEASPGAAGPLVAPATLVEAQAALTEYMTLVSFFVTETRHFAWVIRPNSVELRELRLAAGSREAIDCLSFDVDQQTAENRGTESVNSRPALRVSANCDPARSGELLHETVIKPLRDYFGPGPLLLVPHGLLRSIPFAALKNPRSSRYLVEDFALGYLPSVSVLLALRHRKPSAGDRTLVIGDPATDKKRLPFAMAEALAIADLFNTTPILGAEATEARLREELSSRDVAHLFFSVHGSFDRAESAFSKLYLSRDDEHDGALEAHEVATDLPLPATQLVTLSGCETGLGTRTAGGENLGLVRAFLLAGSRRVLATRWRIKDQETKPLMIEFHSRIIAGETPPEALRQAQLTLLRSEKTAEPYFWAAFMLVGDPASWSIDG